MDLIRFYNWVKVFEARKQYFETGKYISPNRDIFNEKLKGCLSTRFVLVCQRPDPNLLSVFRNCSPAVVAIFNVVATASYWKLIAVVAWAFCWRSKRSPAMKDDEALMKSQSELQRKMMDILKPINEVPTAANKIHKKKVQTSSDAVRHFHVGKPKDPVRWQPTKHKRQ